MSIWVVLTKVSQVSVLIPLITGIVFYKKLSKSFKFFVFYFSIAVIAECAASLSGLYLGNNLFILHFFIPLEFAFFSCVFYLYFFSRRIKRLIFLVFILFVCLALIELIITGLWNHNSITRSFESVFLIWYSLIYFYQYFKSNNEIPVYIQPMFWFSSGVLIYFSIDFFSFMMINQLLKRNIEIAYLSKMIHVFINIIAYLFYTMSFRCFQKTI